MALQLALLGEASLEWHQHGLLELASLRHHWDWLHWDSAEMTLLKW